LQGGIGGRTRPLRRRKLIDELRAEIRSEMAAG